MKTALEKTCSKCGETKPLDDFYRDRTRPDGRECYCAICRKARSNKYNAEHRSARCEYSKKYFHQKYKTDPAYRIKNITRATVWNKNNPEKRREIASASKKRHRVARTSSQKTLRAYLSYGYVRALLCQHSNLLSAKNIPDELVELKTAQLKLLRAVSQLKGGSHE
jgi:hypothetical protein